MRLQHKRESKTSGTPTISLMYFTINITQLDFQYVESTFPNTNRQDLSREESQTLPTLSQILGIFYAKFPAIRLPISRVDFHQHESWRLESSRVESPTFTTLSHIQTVFYAKSLTTSLPISPVDFYHQQPWRLESSRVADFSYPIPYPWCILR